MQKYETGKFDLRNNPLCNSFNLCIPYFGALMISWNLVADVCAYAASAALLSGAEEAAGVQSRLQAPPSDKMSAGEKQCTAVPLL